MRATETATTRRTTASHSLRVVVELENRPGRLGTVAAAIDDVGGNITDVETLEADADLLVRVLTVYTRDEAHSDEVRAALDALAGVHVRLVDDRTFALHRGGKIEVRGTMPVEVPDDLTMVYTPGVGRVSRAIAERPELVRELTIKQNTVAIVTDGTAVLGLGDIGPEAALPVMEGKALLFKEFGGVDAFPVCLRATTVEEIVETVARLEPVFGGINLEDIAAPKCFEVEARLQERVDIPVFHDDQHGTAVVVLAGLTNALKVVGKEMADLSVVISGAGAAGAAVAKILQSKGVSRIVGCDRKGAIHLGREGLDGEKVWFAEHTNPAGCAGTIGDAMVGADVFIGVSGPRLVSPADIELMAPDPIVFALANPEPEIAPELVGTRAAVMATGRSDYANQINNVLCFPGLFRGALDARATRITAGMKVAGAEAIAACVPESSLDADHIIPSVLDRTVAPRVAAAVAAAAEADGVVRA